ncbi:hypothetical protein NEOC84_000894|nr:hypothetical protein [Neochlamydia sp. AcF84]
MVQSTSISQVEIRGTYEGGEKRLESLKNNRSRMKREFHVRVCGSLRGKSPWATRLPS